MEKMLEMFSKNDGCMTFMTKINAELPQTISGAINNKAAEAGQVTAQFLMEKLQEHTSSISDTIQHEMQTNVAQILKVYFGNCLLTSAVYEGWLLGLDGRHKQDRNCQLTTTSWLLGRLQLKGILYIWCKYLSI